MKLKIGDLVKGTFTYPNWTTNSIYPLKFESDNNVNIFYITKSNRKVSRSFPKHINLTPRLIYVLGLLKGEGSNSLGKSNYRRVTVTNTDVEIINLVLTELEKHNIFKKVDLGENSIHLFHYSNSEEEVVNYWSKKLGLSKSKFKCFNNLPKTSGFGVCHVYISDVLLRRIVDLLQDYIVTSNQ